MKAVNEAQEGWESQGGKVFPVVYLGVSSTCQNDLERKDEDSQGKNPCYLGAWRGPNLLAGPLVFADALRCFWSRYDF